MLSHNVCIDVRDCWFLEVRVFLLSLFGESFPLKDKRYHIYLVLHLLAVFLQVFLILDDVPVN